MEKIRNIIRKMQKLVMCELLGKHKYYVIKKYSYTVRKVGCRRCGRVWGMNDRVKAFIEWDGELEELSKEVYGK